LCVVNGRQLIIYVHEKQMSVGKATSVALIENEPKKKRYSSSFG
jgi:hypothetical protein